MGDINMEDSPSIEDRILELCKEHKEGITHKIIQNTLQNITLEEIREIVNKLLIKNKINLDQRADGTLLIKYKYENKSRFQGGSNEERLLVKYISESETNGIASKELRIKSNLQQKNVTLILKSLEKQNVIKFFYAISHPKTKRFILSELEPNRELLGGELYNSENEYDTQLIQVLSEQCCNFLERKSEDAKKNSGGPLAIMMASWTSVKEVHKFIQELGIVNVTLKESDIQSILEGLYYAEKLDESHSSSSGEKIYRFVRPFSEKSTLMSIPCGFCPRINECGDAGHYNALNCKYMNEFEF